MPERKANPWYRPRDDADAEDTGLLSFEHSSRWAVDPVGRKAIPFELIVQLVRRPHIPAWVVFQYEQAAVNLPREFGTFCIGFREDHRRLPATPQLEHHGFRRRHRAHESIRCQSAGLLPGPDERTCGRARGQPDEHEKRESHD